MRSKILVLIFALASSALVPAQYTYVYASQPNSPIPASGTGGAVGGCTNPDNKTLATVSSPEPFKVFDVNVELNFDHTWAHDLRITLSHGNTSVVLFDQHASTVGKGFQGYYAFSDGFPSIAGAVNQNANLANGTYQPAQPLSAFNGGSSFGPWTIEFCDLQSIDNGVLYDYSVTVSIATHFLGNNQQAIPDGSGAGCTSPVTAMINVPAGIGPVSRVYCGLYLLHSRAADLELTLIHGPVSVTLCTANTPPSSLTASGSYTFADWGLQSWDQGLNTGWSTEVPVGAYRPDSPLSAFDGVDSAGPWYFMVCDAVATHTGDVLGLEIGFAVPAYDFALQQPSGSASIVLKNTGGHAGNHYLNAFTLVPGAYPGGWLNGLDIDLADLVTQINWGIPFFGTLDANGSATVTLPGPIPLSLPLQFTSIEITSAGLPLSSIPARTYTTAP